MLTRRRNVAIGLAIIVVLNCLVIIYRYKHRYRAEFGVPEQRSRIDGLIETLESESYEDSVNHLSDDQWYLYPGFRSPLRLDQVDLETMLSNRRCIKVIEHLRRLPDSFRAKQCAELFDVTFEDHTDAIQSALEHQLNPANRKNTVAVLGSKLALCAAMFASAEYGSPGDFRSQVAAVQEFQQSIDNKLRNNATPGDSPAKFAFIKAFYAPDNRFILNVLCLRASNSVKTAERIRPLVANLEAIVVPIVGWRAKITAFDVPHYMEGSPLDMSTGVKTYTFYRWPMTLFYDDAAQKNIISKLYDEVVK